MKIRLAIVLTVLAGLALFDPRPARAAVSFSAGIRINSVADFTAPLTPFGTWINFRTYGRCWHPTRVEADWRPYSNGNWEWTDAGWFWVSTEPWAWACYHYGSWYYDTSYGWVWIPATDWAPAWVVWRSSNTYIGWSPVGPGRVVLAPSFFMFVQVGRFRDRFRPRDLIVNNTTIINQTTVINNFQQETVDFDGSKRGIYVNKGPSVDTIEHATGQKVAARPIRDVVRETPAPENIPEQKPPEERPGEKPPPTGNEQPKKKRKN